MIDAFFVRALLAALVAWLDQRQQEALEYLVESIVFCEDSCGAGAFG